MCYFKDGMKRRIYFDSFGQMTPAEIQKYLKTKKEYETGMAVIRRNTDNSSIRKYPCIRAFVFIRTNLFDT